MPWGYTINQAVRKHQEEDDTFGPLFRALYEFVDRTVAEFCWDEELPMEPVLSMEQCDGRGFFAKKDGYLLPDRINVNPWRHKNGYECAETIAHELVHMTQAEPNHGSMFIARMGDMGIVANNEGDHLSYTGRWPAWMDECMDLNLAAFLLPGMDGAVRVENLNDFGRREMAHVHALGLWCAACEATQP